MLVVIYKVDYIDNRLYIVVNVAIAPYSSTSLTHVE